MAGSGYDPRQAVDFWIAMSTMNEHHVAEFASTHPSDESRIAEMRRHIQARGYA
jgi:predicted Zn-dependent protease